MRLTSVNYSEFEGTPQEWRLCNLTLWPINLLVGKNAAGKTRSLNILSSIARQLSDVRRVTTLTANYDLSFCHEDQQLRYSVKIDDMQVTSEQYWVGDNVMLDRGDRGEGRIFAEQVDGGKMLRFQTPQTELAAVARRDAIQHRFLEPLYEWGASLRHYFFGSKLGKDNYAIFVEKGGVALDERDNDAVVALFRKAIKEFGTQFTEAVTRDMAELDYLIEDVRIAPPVSIRFGDVPGELVGLTVKEADLLGVTDQFSMSQGMFRALSLIIQVNYAQMAHKASCFLIDDIGEGLDFERSCRLIGLLRKKAQGSAVQLIMSTNDRFVMNKVPLEEWSLLQRKGPNIAVRNYENSRAIFDEFKFTGLSNFDFLATNFIEDQITEEVVAQ